MKVQALYCFFFVGVLMNILTKVSSNEDAISDNKIRLSSCVKLANARLTEDKDYLETITKQYFQNIAAHTYDQVYLGLRQKILLGCFSEISLIKSAEVHNAKTINSYTKENKKLLASETYNDRYSADEERLAKDLKRFNSLVEESAELSEFEEKIYEKL